jgi:hypothetical protein
MRREMGPPGVIAGKFTVTRSSGKYVRASFPSHGDMRFQGYSKTFVVRVRLKGCDDVVE